MSERDPLRGATARVLDVDDVEGVLTGAFYSSAAPPRRPALSVEQKPQHYKVICISLYNDDLTTLDQMVESLKSRGLTKANRSALIRYALAQVDLDRVPRGL